MIIKNWFLIKNFTQNERMIIEAADVGGELEVLKETEKAVFFQATSDWGDIKILVPEELFNRKRDGARETAEGRVCGTV